MATYVMSDIHGELELFEKMLKEINFDDSDCLYILGDVVDRGPQPIELLKFIKEQPSMKLLMGNHEQLFLDHIQEGVSFRYLNKQIHIETGGYNTVVDYENLTSNEQKEIQNYLKTLDYAVVTHTDKFKYILVHAGLNMTGIIGSDIDRIMTKQSDEDLLWSREEFYLHPAVNGYTIIFGHTPTCYLHDENPKEGNYKFEIWHDPKHHDKIGIDCGATFGRHGGKLACLRLEDQEEFYVK